MTIVQSLVIEIRST